MLDSINTHAQPNRQSPALQFPADPSLSWPEYLDKVSAVIQDCYKDDPRAWMVAALIREAATVAHLQNLTLFEHQQLLLDSEDYDPEPEPDPDNGPAAPTAGGIGWGLDDQWDLRNL